MSVLRQGNDRERRPRGGNYRANELAQMMVGRDVELSVTRRAEQVGEKLFRARLSHRVGVPILRDVPLPCARGDSLHRRHRVGTPDPELSRYRQPARRQPNHMELFKDGKPQRQRRRLPGCRRGHAEDRMTRGPVLEMSTRTTRLLAGHCRSRLLPAGGLRLASAILQIAEQERTEFAIKAPNLQERCSAPLRRQPAEGGHRPGVPAKPRRHHRGPAQFVADVGAMEYLTTACWICGRRQVRRPISAGSGRGAQPVRPSGGHSRWPDRG